MDTTKLSKRGIWLRGLYMLLFWLIYNIAEVVLIAMAIFQFIYTLIMDKANLRLQDFGQSLSVYIYQIWRFLTFNTEELPFPFSPWPEGHSNRDWLSPPVE